MAHKPVENLRKPLTSEHVHHDTFITQYNIHFGYPHTDTCSTCDNLTMQIQAASAESKHDLEESLQAHQQPTEEGYSAYTSEGPVSHINCVWPSAHLPYYISPSWPSSWAFFLALLQY